MSNSVSHKGKLRGTTLYELGSTVKRAYGSGKVNPRSKTIVDDLRPVKINLDEGYHVVEPKHLASFLVATQEVTDGLIHGYQRPQITRPHIRKIANAIENGDVMSVIEVGLYKNGLWVIDGQHRALASIMANTPAPVVVRKMTAEEQAKLFASQYRAKKVNPSNLILSAADDHALYVQDAVTSNKNPWSKLVTHTSSSAKKMTPKQMYDSVLSYTSSTLGRHAKSLVDHDTFDKKVADESATLFGAFGNKATNPLAFKPLSIKAIAYASVVIIRRRGSHKADIQRWVDWMPTFRFADYQGLRSSKELATAMIRHWNKRLHADNKVTLPDELL